MALAGSSRPATIIDSAAAPDMQLDDEDLRMLGQHAWAASRTLAKARAGA
jgi:hypothetical protein